MPIARDFWIEGYIGQNEMWVGLFEGMDSKLARWLEDQMYNEGESIYQLEPFDSDSWPNYVLKSEKTGENT